VGEKFMELMDNYRHLAQFGFLVEDTSRGEVRPGYKGSPFITYSMNEHDTKRMARGVAVLSEVFLAAGAKRVFPFLPGAQEVRSYADVAAMRELTFTPGDFEITAYHPLGTCRVGTDPETSVLGPDHEAHEVRALYVTDGSAVPSALGVNPQMTIMAMALRAAEIIDARL
jgi:choline dehydrogenase-like flavoprotein